MRRPELRWLFALVALAGLVLDVLTKVIVVSRLDPEAPVRLLGGLLTLRLIRNPGAAFSLGERFTFVFALLSVAVLRGSKELLISYLLPMMHTCRCRSALSV